MNNIEKFKKIKELNKLKSEYHREQFVELVTFNEGPKEASINLQSIFEAGKSGYNLFQFIKLFINNKKQ